MAEEENKGAVSEVFHYQYNATPLKVKLIKGQKDSYGWEISCSGAEFKDIIEQIKEADKLLKGWCGQAQQ